MLRIDNISIYDRLQVMLESGGNYEKYRNFLKRDIGLFAGFIISQIACNKRQEEILHPSDTLPFKNDSYEDSFFDEKLFPREFETILEELKLKIIQHPAKQFEDKLAKDKIIEQFHNLQIDLEPSSNKLARLNHARAIKDNVVQLVIGNIQGKQAEIGSASGLKINRAGYFLTVAHAIREGKNQGWVLDEQNAIAYRINDVLLQRESDFAIVFAPTASLQNKINGLIVSDKPLQTGQRLWQYSYLPYLQLALKSGINLSNILTGQVDLSFRKIILSGFVENPPEQFKNPNTPWQRIRVRDMKSFGGASGAPIIDDQGRLVGIESGVYLPPNAENLRSNYTGSTISSLTNFEQAIGRAEHLKFSYGG
jgi:hypothetical protein